MGIIKFNKHIYNLEAINQAIKEFKNLAEFSIKETNDFFEIKLDNINGEVKEIIKDEFANYVLGLMG